MSGLRGMGPRRGIASRVTWRAMLSALAGGGLTVAGLGGPLAGGALGAETPTGSTTTGEGAEPPVTSTTPEVGTSTTGSGQSTTSTSTAPASTPSSAPSSTSTSATTTTGPSIPAPSSAPAPAAGEAPAVLVRHKQQTTPSRPASRSNLTQTKAKPTGGGSSKSGNTSASGGANATAGAPNDVAPPPQVVAGQAEALAAMLGGSAASVQALDFYRVPLFLLPIYRAAAIQYDVPWPILAAINEIETDYGTDLSVSSAGAEGWMQFEPATWLQYGVDALNAGYADPYNPVDAIFAAARYLNAAGAAHNLSAAILAYNHSAEYVESVLLRAKLIAAYPNQVIATLTGLVDGRSPVTGKHIGWDAPASAAGTAPLPSPSSATAGASAVSPSASGTVATTPGSSADATPGSSAAAPGSSVAPTPSSAASSASTKEAALQFVDVTSEPTAHAVAVQNGRIVKLGSSRKLGRYVILQDVYGDVFTYAGLGGIARSYTPAEPQSAANTSAQAASASTQTGSASGGAPTAESTPTGTSKVRVFAHPGNPDARAAIRLRGGAERAAANGRLPLRSGSIVTEGTMLGHVATPAGARDGHLRFAIRPAGDSSTIDPRAILSNWTQLDAALHPQGAKGNPNLLGATASDVFLLSKGAARARGAVRSEHRAVGMLPPRSRLWGDRQARAGGARVPVAQRPEADRRHAALRGV